MADITKNVKGSEAWAKAIRKQVKGFAHTVLLDYVELSKALWDIFSTPIDGNPNNPPIYFQWNYTKFGEYAKAELGLSPRKADYLKAIGYMLSVELKDADPELMERLLQLGWSKLRELSTVIRKPQLLDWILKAEQATFEEIKVMVRTFKENEEIAAQERAISGANYTLARDPFAPPANPEQTEQISVASDGMDVNVAVSGAEFTSTPAQPVERVYPPVLTEVPAPEKITAEVFHLFEDQNKIVKQALAKASLLSSSEKKNNNLYLICMDFLASNDFKGDENVKLKFLAKMEKYLGYKLIAANPIDYTVAYGINNLQKVAAAQIEQAQEQVEEMVVTR